MISVTVAPQKKRGQSLNKVSETTSCRSWFC